VLRAAVAEELEVRGDIEEIELTVLVDVREKKRSDSK